MPKPSNEVFEIQLSHTRAHSLTLCIVCSSVNKISPPNPVSRTTKHTHTLDPRINRRVQVSCRTGALELALRPQQLHTQLTRDCANRQRDESTPHTRARARTSESVPHRTPISLLKKNTHTPTTVPTVNVRMPGGFSLFSIFRCICSEQVRASN